MNSCAIITKVIYLFHSAYPPHDTDPFQVLVLHRKKSMFYKIALNLYISKPLWVRGAVGEAEGKITVHLFSDQ